ncbi:uncharacterized protein WCC33_014811 [Rhinophrynus dorsalis]
MGLVKMNTAIISFNKPGSVNGSKVLLKTDTDMVAAACAVNADDFSPPEDAVCAAVSALNAGKTSQPQVSPHDVPGAAVSALNAGKTSQPQVSPHDVPGAAVTVLDDGQISPSQVSPSDTPGAAVTVLDDGQISSLQVSPSVAPGTNITVQDAGQDSLPQVSLSVVQDEDVVEETKNCNSTPPPTPKEKCDPDSGNELSSFSLDSHESSKIYTDLPIKDILPTVISCQESNEECPPRPSTLDLSQSHENHTDGEVTASCRNSMEGELNKNGIKNDPKSSQLSEEKKALEGELVKCIEEFRRIKIPMAFPNKKRNWQNELIKKYQL